MRPHQCIYQEAASVLFQQLRPYLYFCTWPESLRPHEYICSVLRRATACEYLHTSAYVRIRQHTSAYVSIRQHTSAYVRIRQLRQRASTRRLCGTSRSAAGHTRCLPCSCVSVSTFVPAAASVFIFFAPAAASVFVPSYQQLSVPMPSLAAAAKRKLKQTTKKKKPKRRSSSSMRQYFYLCTSSCVSICAFVPAAASVFVLLH